MRHRYDAGPAWPREGARGMRRFTCALLAVALLVSGLLGCAPAPGTSGTPSGPPTATPPPSAPSSSPATPSVSPTSPAPTTQPVDLDVYFIFKEKVQAVHRSAPAGTKGVLKAALVALLAGPTATEKAAGLTSAIPSGTTLRGVTVSGNVATVDLSSKYVSGGGSLSMLLRIAQVVYTATQFDPVDSVRFSVNGKVVSTIGGEGVMVGTPQTRGDWEGQTPAILVEEPAWGGVLREGGTMRGTANVFEAAFRVRLTASGGKVIFDRKVMATSGTGTRGTWSMKVTLYHSIATAGTLRVYDLSAKDGKPENVIDIPVELAP